MSARKPFSKWVLLLLLLFTLLSAGVLLTRTDMAASDSGGLWISGVTPAGGSGQPFDKLEIQFSDAVQDGTFALDDVTFGGPGGPITPALTKLAADRYELDASGQTGLNTYSLTIGPHIQDIGGQEMDQDHDGTRGEAKDAYIGALFSAGVTITKTETIYEGQNLILYGDTCTIDGSHSIASLQVLGGATLAHSPTTADTEYRLELTITDTLFISTTSKIDVSERGYLGGRTVGNATEDAARGIAGGSYGGLGMEWAGGTTNRPYGDYRDPNELGSGGALNGGAGGGLACVTAGSAIIDGSILANGGAGGYYSRFGGAGGGIRLDVGTLSGSGTIAANGGYWSDGQGGGGGRVAVYYDTLDGFDPANQVTAHGGGGYYGAASVGTVYLKQSGSEGQLRLDSHGAYAGLHTPLGLSSDTAFVAEHLVISGTNVVAAPEHEMPVHANNVSVFGGGSISHQAATITDTYSLRLTVTGTLLISTTGKIDVSNRGYLVGRTTGNTTRDAASGTSGGSYGGLGYSAGGGTANPVYGDYRNPSDLGSGGGALSGGGSGGGLVRITAASAVVDGQILADGGNGWYGNPSAGSGGGILLNVGTLSGGGTVRARGGWGYGGGSGGGGRVAAYVWDTVLLTTTNVTAPGGGGLPGEDGSVCFADVPFFVLKGPSSVLFHDTEQLSWEPLGANPSGVTADLHVSDGGQTDVIGSDLPAVGSLNWDTTSVSDGQYELRATFYDASSQVIGQATLDALVVNSGITWHSGQITAHETWAAGEMHVVEGEVTIASGVTLTLEAGVVVKFAYDAGLTVQDGATLDAPATAASPIVLTALADDTAGGDTNLDGSQTLPLPGDWNGLFIPGTGQVNLNDYVELRYIKTTHAGTLGGDETWLDTFMHIVNGDLLVPSGATLTIQPGAGVKLYPNRGITVQDGGQLIAQGNVAQPILFTSMYDDVVGGDTNNDSDQTSPAAGDWRGINVDGGQASLDHVVMSYGAGTASGTWDSTAAAISARNAGTVALANSVIHDAFFEGVIAWGSGDVTITNTVIAGADRAVNSDGSAIVRLTNCTLDDNRIGIWGHGGTLEIANTIIANSFEAGIDNILGSPITIRYSNVWSPTGSNYVRMSSQTGTDGNVSVDPEFKDSESGNYRLQYLSPMIDAADGTVAGETDFMGAPRYDDPRTENTGIATPGGAFADIGAFEFVETAASNIDLVVTAVEGPLTATAGEQATIQWTVTNTGTEAAVGPWHDAIALVHSPEARPTIIEIQEVFVGENVTLGPGQSHSASAQVRVPGSVAGQHYWRIVTNSRFEVFEGQNIENNKALSAHAFALDVSELVIDGPALSPQFTAAGESQWFRFTTVGGQDIRVSLDLANDSGTSELYVGYEFVPTRDGYDARSQQWNSADTSVFVGNTLTGTHYILACGTLPGGFELQAETRDFSVVGVSPDSGGNAGQVTVNISGEAILEDATAKLVHATAGDVPAATTYWVDSTQLVAAFDLQGIPVGLADVVLVSDSQERALADAFEVQDGGAADVWWQITGPDTVRVGRPAEYAVTWGNRGNIDAPVYLVMLEVSALTSLFLETTGEDITEGYQFLAMTPDAATPVLPPGARESLRFRMTTSGFGDFWLDASAVAVTDPSLVAQVIDWEPIRAAAKPEELSIEQWNALFDEMTADLGDNWSEVAQTLADDSLDWIHALDSPLYPQEAGIGLRPALLDAISRAETALSWNTELGELYTFTPAPDSASSRPGRLLPLVVTVRNYEGSGSKSLEGTIVDFGNIYGLLTKKAQVDPKRVNVVTDAVRKRGQPWRTPTLADTQKAVRALTQSAGPDDTVFIYMSGHGQRPTVDSLGGLEFRSERKYLWSHLLKDIGYTDPPTNSVPTRAGHIVIVLDVCYSGSLITRMDSYTDLPPDVAKRVTILAASGSYERAQSKPKCGGFFTYHFVKAFQDPETDKNKDGVITMQEVARAIPKDVSGWTFEEQSPKFHPASADVPLRDPAGKSKDGTSSGLNLQAPSASGGPVTFKGRSGAASDPNDKLAPGHGDAGWVAPDERLVYTVHFENIAPEGVPSEFVLPAQTVVVTDQLSADLDWSTFELEAIGFNNTMIRVPPGLMVYETMATVATDPNRVVVTAELDAATGLITWRMQSFDDRTGLLPEDPVAGFLPVNDETGAGEGFVTYRIGPRTGLPDGAEIYNQASIIFDVNEPIVTNIVTNTIDGLAPTSSVNPLPGESPSPFTVSWSGHDAGGSGIAFYDVCVSTDGGPFVSWQTGITETQATFSGTVGSTYGFYSAATDNVGHQQPTPAGAQASTTITLTEVPIAGLVASNDSPTELGSATAITATITAGSNVTYIWAFGDGNIGSGAVVTYTYPDVGGYTAIVTASNSVGVVTDTTAVTITDVPIAGLDAVNDSPTELGSATTITATITAGSNVTYTWAFGDGEVGNGAVVTYTYPDVGGYTAIVTASNSVGIATASTTVTITEPEFYIYLPLVVRTYP